MNDVLEFRKIEHHAIFHACGVRIREHPITKDAIMAGLRAKGVVRV